MKKTAIAILLVATGAGYPFACDAARLAVGINETDSAAVSMTSGSVHADNPDVAELSEKLAVLQEAFDAVFPYAEFCIMTSDLPIGDGGFETVDTAELKQSANLLKLLSPYSDAIKSRRDTLLRFIDIAERYNDLTEFDKEPYSQQLVDSTANGLLEIYDNGGGVINDAKGQQIDSLYVKADTYRNAVEKFAGIIEEIDSQTGQFRDNDAADKLCREEIGNVMANTTAEIADIKRYRYLADLYRRYAEELDRAPRSMTGDIRREIAAMLGEEKRTATDEGNENQQETPLTTPHK